MPTWAALLAFALLMIVPLMLFIAYQWIFRAWSRLLRMSRRLSGEVWISPKGIRDSLGRSVVFHDENHYLAEAEIRMTGFGSAIHLKCPSFVKGVSDMGVDYIFTSSFLVPVPPGKENEAELAVGVLRGTVHLPPGWVRKYNREHGD